MLINRAAEIYAPFAAAEVTRLKEYRDTVESLLAKEAVTSAWSWKITAGEGQWLDYVGEDALHDLPGSSGCSTRSRADELRLSACAPSSARDRARVASAGASPQRAEDSEQDEKAGAQVAADSDDGRQGIDLR